jgi:hypothetical protein
MRLRKPKKGVHSYAYRIEDVRYEKPDAERTEDLTHRGKEDEERAGRWSGEASAVAFVVES